MSSIHDKLKFATVLQYFTCCTLELTALESFAKQLIAIFPEALGKLQIFRADVFWNVLVRFKILKFEELQTSEKNFND